MNGELKALKVFISGLPENGYLKNSLEACLPDIERDIASDFCPDILGTLNHLHNERNRLEGIVDSLKKDSLRLEKDIKEKEEYAAFIQRKGELERDGLKKFALRLLQSI